MSARIARDSVSILDAIHDKRLFGSAFKDEATLTVAERGGFEPSVWISIRRNHHPLTGCPVPGRRSACASSRSNAPAPNIESRRARPPGPFPCHRCESRCC
jgi:hypothetical protein